MRLIKYPSKEQWTELLKRPALNTENLFDTVRSIINKVRAEGDKADLLAKIGRNRKSGIVYSGWNSTTFLNCIDVGCSG